MTLALVIILSTAFSVVSGFNDGGNLMAAAAASRTITPARAYLLIVAGALAGPIVAGTAVAATIGAGIVDFAKVGPLPLVAGTAGATASILFAYGTRFPTSASIALVAAMLGSLLVEGDLWAVQWGGVAKVAAGFVGAIVIGFGAGLLAYAIVVALLVHTDRRTGERFMQLQYLTVLLQAAGYGANDAEKMMGLIAAAALGGAAAGRFAVPWWAIALVIASFALGTALGGTRVARTVGGKLFSIRPIHALSFQAAAAATVLAASALGGPLSTTQATASSILGVGASANPRALHWLVARDLILSWIVTVPVGFAAGALATFVLQFAFR